MMICFETTTKKTEKGIAKCLHSTLQSLLASCRKSYERTQVTNYVNSIEPSMKPEKTEIH